MEGPRSLPRVLQFTVELSLDLKSVLPPAPADERFQMFLQVSFVIIMSSWLHQASQLAIGDALMLSFSPMGCTGLQSGLCLTLNSGTLSPLFPPEPEAGISTAESLESGVLVLSVSTHACGKGLGPGAALAILENTPFFRYSAKSSSSVTVFPESDCDFFARTTMCVCRYWSLPRGF